MIAGIPFGPGEGQGSARGSNFYHGTKFYSRVSNGLENRKSTELYTRNI